MTIAELNPEDSNRAQRFAATRGDIENAAIIDEEANRLVEYLVGFTDETEADPELIRKSVDFVSRLVGWSSKNLDEATGQVRVAQLDMTNEHDVELDKLGLNFFGTSKGVESSTTADEQTHTTAYFFHQLRKSGKVRAITVYRKRPIVEDEASFVTYCLTYEDVGEYTSESESRLALGRLWLESTSPAKFAHAAVVKTLDARNRVLRFGHDAVAAILPTESASSEER